MCSSKVVNIDFFTRGTLPKRLGAMAKEQGVPLGSDLVMVKTIIGPPLSYDFVSVGTNPEDIQNLMKKLAKEDGVDLGKAVEKAFSEVLPQSSEHKEAEG